MILIQTLLSDFAGYHHFDLYMFSKYPVKIQAGTVNKFNNDKILWQFLI